MTDIIILAAAYLLGSIPFGVLITRLAGLPDLRQIGSGNIGATNVLRTGRVSLAIITLLFDALKGTLAVLLAAHFSPSLVPFAALLVLLGHFYPIWLGFRGGKGVATALGVWLALSPLVFGLMLASWILAALASRRSSVGALAMMALLPVYVWLLGLGEMLLTVALLTMALVVYRHLGNIARLLAGTEPKIGNKS